MDWSTELRSQNLTKAQAKTRADEAKDTIKILKKDLKPVKEQPTAAEKKQAAVASSTNRSRMDPDRKDGSFITNCRKRGHW